MSGQLSLAGLVHVSTEQPGDCWSTMALSGTSGGLSFV